MLIQSASVYCFSSWIYHLELRKLPCVRGILLLPRPHERPGNPVSLMRSRCFYRILSHGTAVYARFTGSLCIFVGDPLLNGEGQRFFSCVRIFLYVPYGVRDIQHRNEINLPFVLLQYPLPPAGNGGVPSCNRKFLKANAVAYTGKNLNRVMSPITCRIPGGLSSRMQALRMREFLMRTSVMGGRAPCIRDFVCRGGEDHPAAAFV